MFASMKCFISIALFLASDYWDISPDAPYHSSVVKITQGDMQGSGVLISSDGKYGLVATCGHVVERNAKEIKVEYTTKRRSGKCKILAEDDSDGVDVAILWVCVDPNVQPSQLAQRAPGFREKLEFVGYGGGKAELRHFLGTMAQPGDEEMVYSDVILLQGDSGGAIFNSDHQVVGLISGGWFWWSGRNGEEDSASMTWPACGPGIKPIRRLMEMCNRGKR